MFVSMASIVRGTSDPARQIRLDDVERHAAPAEARPKEGVLRAEVGQPPRPGENTPRSLPSDRFERSLSTNWTWPESSSLESARAWPPEDGAGTRPLIADDEQVLGAQLRRDDRSVAADAERAATFEDRLDDGAQPLDRNPQRRVRELRVEGGDGRGQHLGREHHVHDDAHSGSRPPARPLARALNRSML